MLPSRVLVYHKVDSRFEWGITRVTPAQFEQQVSTLSKAGYSLVTLSDWFDNPYDEKTVAITFDDGYESVYHNALPVLEKYNAKATIFVISDYIGQENLWDVNIGWLKFRHLNSAQLLELAELGHEVGSHTCTHKVLVDADETTILADFKRSKVTLESLINRKVRFIAYPFGRFNSRLLELTSEAGYDGGCIFMPYNHELLKSAPRLIYRQGIYLTDTKRSVLGKIQPGLRFQMNRLKQNVINWAAGGTIMVNSLWKKNKS